jgi:hypothetical protein
MHPALNIISFELFQDVLEVLKEGFLWGRDKAQEEIRSPVLGDLIAVVVVEREPSMLGH